MKIISPKIPRFTHDNMGTEYEIICRLFFGFYIVRPIGTLHWVIEYNP